MSYAIKLSRHDYLFAPLSKFITQILDFNQKSEQFKKTVLYPIKKPLKLHRKPIMNFSSLCFLLFSLLLLIPCINLQGFLQTEETPVTKYLRPIEIDYQESGMELIDCIYVINLDERPEKWKRINELLKEKGIHANRVSAINGWLLTQQERSELLGPYDSTSKITNPFIGSLLSHVSTYKDAYTREFDIVWVLEDSADFIQDIHILPSYLKNLSEIDPDWDIFYTDIDLRHISREKIVYVRFDPKIMSGRPDQLLLSPEEFKKRIQIGNDMMRIYSRYGATSMFISKKGLKKLNDYFLHVYLWDNLDHELHFIEGIKEYSPLSDIASRLLGCPSDKKQPPPSL